ncbi:ABC transporter permease [Acidicapsa acidisoli]|uniref:ABC transporter permease n=1 Tax=Acidicapsa acidisoli TaxID=1615681 RepID=UPI0021DF7B9B|nr:ABC transporter permease [Acidicapsa acidisoli]
MKPFRQVRAFLLRVSGIFGGERRQRSFADEIDCHLQLHIDDNVRLGMPPGQARREAILKLGGIERARQSYRERSTLPMMDDLLRDLRFALRQLRRSPGFAITAILMLALGIGASAAIFAFVDAALLKPLPYRDPTKLVAVTERVKLFPRANLSYPDYLDWKKLNTVFSSFDVYNRNGYMLGTSSGAEPVAGARVSDGFFRTLGVKPLLGRDFYAGEDLPGVAPTVLLTYSAWKLRFSSRQDIVGQTINLSGVPTTVIGVLPEKFQFAPHGAAEFYTPFQGKKGCDLNRGCHSLYGIARLKDGVSISSALAEMKAIAAQLERQYPDTNRGQGATVEPLADVIVGDIRPILLMLLTGAGLLLMIACVNVASLLLVRSESRRREIAVRGALGASRLRLARQFVTEGMVLVLIGCVLGIGLSDGAMQSLLGLIPKAMLLNMPYLVGLKLNRDVLLFSAGVAFLVVILLTVIPMLRVALHGDREGLTDGRRGASGTLWRHFGANLVVLELTIAVILLVSAGLLGKSLYRLLHVDVNFEVSHLATIEVMAPQALYPKDEQLVRLGREVVRRVSALPGVESAGITSVLPVTCNCNTDWIRFVGKPYNGEHNEVNLRDVSADFFKVLHAKLLSGRYFTDAEDASRPKVVIINESLARQYFPGEDPIGKKIGGVTLAPDSLKEIVGVVDDIHEGSLESPIWPAVYYPINQDTDNAFSVVVRTSQSETSLLPQLVRAVRSIDPGIGTAFESTMEQLVEDSQSAYIHRSSAWLVSGFAALALVLSVVGLYGVIAYSVSQRTREIGVRMALGAQRSSVYRLVMREAGRLTFAGIGLGLVSSVGTATLMRKLLFGTAAWDTATLASVGAVLGVSAMLASYIPARRAASVNPVEALRAE